jgi:uncharacterized protein (TIGR01777 family)
MQVLVSGAHGLVGGHLVEALGMRGDTVHRLVRSANGAAPGDLVWDPTARALDQGMFQGFDAVVHLAGESISGLWTARKKREIRTSRVRDTSLLAGALAQLDAPPQVLVVASAVGYYGDRADEVLTERSPAGTGFLADVVRDWEAAADPAREAGIRVTHMRTGIVQSRHGGQLQLVGRPFRFGLGGRLGSGRQYFSWVQLDDLVAAYQHVIDSPNLGGPVNATAPAPVTNAEYTRALGEALHRPTFLPVPAFVMKALPGGMGSDLLASQRAIPQRLLDNGFCFDYGEIRQALEYELS